MLLGAGTSARETLLADARAVELPGPGIVLARALPADELLDSAGMAAWLTASRGAEPTQRSARSPQAEPVLH